MDCVSLRKDRTKFVHYAFTRNQSVLKLRPFHIGTERKYHECCSQNGFYPTFIDLFMRQVYLKMFDFDENIICDWYFDSTHRLVIWWIRYDSFLSVRLIE